MELLPEAFDWVLNVLQQQRQCSTGSDTETLKGGCTKFSGPELPYSGFDPFLNVLQLPPFESLSSIQEYNLALNYMEILTE